MRGGVYWSLVVDPTDSVDTVEVISIRSTSEDAPVNKNNNDATVIGYLDSYLSFLTIMISPLL